MFNGQPFSSSAGLYQRVFLTPCAHHPPLRDARTASGSAGFAATTKHYSAATAFGRFRYIRFAERFPQNDVRSERLNADDGPINVHPYIHTSHSYPYK